MTHRLTGGLASGLAACPARRMNPPTMPIESARLADPRVRPQRGQRTVGMSAIYLVGRGAFRWDSHADGTD
jgi:hypothetical protein